MAPTLPPTASEINAAVPGLSAGAIVMITVGAYVVAVIIALLIRQCLKSQGVSICPAWVTEQCCGGCCAGCCAGPDDGPSCFSSCLVSFAEMCDCSAPTKKSCMDSVCPSKEWCDDTFCCCMNNEPGGELCQDCQGPECNCGTCNCACQCDMPESLNCICFTIQLK